MLGRAWKTACEIVITFPIPLASMYALETAALAGFTRARWYHGRLKRTVKKISIEKVLKCRDNMLYGFHSKRYWPEIFRSNDQCRKLLHFWCFQEVFFHK